jgi:hypothetical protein
MGIPEMQESAPAFLDAVVQASKERLAKKKLAVQPAQAIEGDQIACRRKKRERSGSRRRRTRE